MAGTTALASAQPLQQGTARTGLEMQMRLVPLVCSFYIYILILCICVLTRMFICKLIDYKSSPSEPYTATPATTTAKPSLGVFLDY